MILLKGVICNLCEKNLGDMQPDEVPEIESEFKNSFDESIDEHVAKGGKVAIVCDDCYKEIVRNLAASELNWKGVGNA
jgi:hypothetical protein